jgi:cyclopropane fatty-acyl-phospholipid synthase-like methyltransferase
VAPKPIESETLGGRYAASGNAALVAAELEALGSDYQANGYTTVAQADELGRLLGLDQGQVLLDIGSGCGWPGLHLAARHGCSVISADPIDEGGDAARQRAIADGLADRSLAVRAEGAALPIRPESVDAVVHSDVLC